MNIIVQKYGGTSVSEKNNRALCFKHISNALKDGYKVVVVVSAMGRQGDSYSTDTLLKIAPNLNAREKDLLLHTGELISASVFSSELNELGIKNTVLTGGQAGIITNDKFGDAQIEKVDNTNILNTLKDQDVIIVTGFQGSTIQGAVTTLGRGGSDTSATALGGSLNASYVDIFTDVEGIMTADPRIVKEAKVINTTSYDEILNLAEQGAKVIHPRAVEYAKNYKVPVRVRSTFSERPGTLITEVSKGEINSNSLFSSITYSSEITQFSIDFSSGNETRSFFVFAKENEVSLDLINITKNNVRFTIKEDDSLKVYTYLSKLNETSSKMIFERNKEVVKISLVGERITNVPGVMGEIYNTLHTLDIPILQTTDSHTTIWVLVSSDKYKDAIKCLHSKFRLEQLSYDVQ